MASLPKSIIKRYGISKKAWSVYRSGRSTLKRASTGGNVARRKSSVRRRSSRGGLGGIGNILITGAVYGVARGLIPNQYDTPLVRGGAGAAAMYLGRGMVHDVGKLAVQVEVANLAGSFAGGMTSTLSSSATTPGFTW